jgi:hypothetical protein
MAKGKKTGGRRRGTPNKATAARQAAIAASGKTPLEIMIENARWAYDKALKLTALLSGPDAPQGEEASALMQDILKFRDAAQRYASAAAPYVHPRLGALWSVDLQPERLHYWRPESNIGFEATPEFLGRRVGTGFEA